MPRPSFPCPFTPHAPPSLAQHAPLRCVALRCARTSPSATHPLGTPLPPPSTWTHLTTASEPADESFSPARCTRHGAGGAAPHSQSSRRTTAWPGGQQDADADRRRPPRASEPGWAKLGCAALCCAVWRPVRSLSRGNGRRRPRRAGEQAGQARARAPHVCEGAPPARSLARRTCLCERAERPCCLVPHARSRPEPLCRQHAQRGPRGAPVLRPRLCRPRRAAAEGRRAQRLLGAHHRRTQRRIGAAVRLTWARAAVPSCDDGCAERQREELRNQRVQC